MRVLIAGILGGIAMYVWATVAHLTPLGAVGVRPVPNTPVAVATLSLDLGGQGGLYVFPGPTAAKGGPTTGAAGLLVYSPHAPLTLSPRQLVSELGLEIVESLLLAALLALVAGGFGARVGAALLVGVIAAVTTNLSYWNWYGFPLDYTLATGFTELVKYLVAGVVIALMLGRRRAAAA